jgi:hypothetical protein
MKRNATKRLDVLMSIISSLEEKYGDEEMGTIGKLEELANQAHNESDAEQIIAGFHAATHNIDAMRLSVVDGTFDVTKIGDYSLDHKVFGFLTADQPLQAHAFCTLHNLNYMDFHTRFNAGNIS